MKTQTNVDCNRGLLFTSTVLELISSRKFVEVFPLNNVKYDRIFQPVLRDQRQCRDPTLSIEN